MCMYHTAYCYCSKINFDNDNSIIIKIIWEILSYNSYKVYLIFIQQRIDTGMNKCYLLLSNDFVLDVIPEYKQDDKNFQ